MTRTRSPLTSTSSNCLVRAERVTRCSLKPSVPVSWVRTVASLATVPGSASTLTMCAGTSFLGDHRDEPGVECSGVHEGTNRVGQHLAGDVVHVGFEHHEVLLKRDLRRCVSFQLTDDHLEHVRHAVEVTAASAVAAASNLHLRQRPERLRQSRRAGRRR